MVIGHMSQALAGAPAVLGTKMSSPAAKGKGKDPGARPQPGMTMWFQVTVGGAGQEVDLGRWSGCTGLKMSLGVEEVWSGGDYDAPYYVPTQVKYGTLTLERAMDKDSSAQVRAWLQAVAKKWIGGTEGGAGMIPSGGKKGKGAKDGDVYQGVDVTVTLFSSLGGSAAQAGEREVSSWKLANAVPTEWEGPRLSAKGGEVALEKLTLAHRGFLDPAASGTPGTPVSTQGSGRLTLSYTPSGRTAPEAEVDFQYNPTELTLDRVNDNGGAVKDSVQLVSATASKVQEFNKVSLRLKELHLEGVTAIEQKCKLLWAWLEPDVDKSGKKNKKSKKLKITMGAAGTAKAKAGAAKTSAALDEDVVLREVEVRYTRFTPTGLPSRAKVTLSVEVVPREPKKTNPSSGGPPGGRAHTVSGAENLPQVATGELGDPNRWREIAEANGVDDPLRVRRGSVLRMPGG